MTCRACTAILQCLFVVLFALGLTSACAAGSDFNVVPLEQKAVGVGNTEIRVVYIESLGIESSMLLLERTAGVSKAIYYFPSASYVEPHKTVSLVPNTDWLNFWPKLDNLGINALATEKDAKKLPHEKMSFDPEHITIELKNGPTYREIRWSAPTSRTNPEAKRFAKIVDFIQETFAVTFPEAHGQTGSSVGRKQTR